MATNIPTYSLNATAVSAREAEVPNADFSGGMNLGSCAQGIGIATGISDIKETDFTQVDPAADYTTQHIGGDGLDSGSTTSFNVKAAQGADLNDDVAYVAADANTAPDAVLDATTGAVNKTGATVAAGVYAWGVVPVA